MRFPSPATDYLEDRIDLNALVVAHPSATFYMAVETDAMSGDHIMPHSLAIVDRSLNARNNDIIVASLNGELLLRRLSTTNEGNFLMPSNHQLSPMKIEEGMQFEVWGVVSAIISNPNNVAHVRLGRLQ
jgi:DNA polymerase V